MMDSVIQFRGTIYENGYGLIAQKVMRDKRLPKQSKLIYAYMCSFAGVDKDGNRSAFPSVSLQCDELGMNQDTYYKWRKYLVQYGYITIEKKKDEQGKFDRNLYFIEAVPVEVEEEKPKNTDTEPYPKKSGTVNPSTEKSGTNSNSFNNNSFNKDNTSYIDNTDDDKRTNSSAEHNEESINLIISNLRAATKDDLKDISFNAVVNRVVDKYNQGKIGDGKFRDYLVSALANKIEELELRRMKDNAKKELYQSKKQETETKLKELEINKDVPFYNWLDLEG